MKQMNNAFNVINEKFNFIEGNREVIDERHIRNIMNSMMEGNFIPPITVDTNTKLIVDGQHRYAAAMNLWKQGIAYPLSVIFAHFDNPLLAAITYNNRSKNWRTSTFVNAYIADNRNSYILLKKFCKDHRFLTTGEKYKYSSAIMILTSNYKTAVVQAGTLVVTPEQCLQGSTIYNELESMLPIIPIALQKHVIGAWLQIRNEVLGKVTFAQYLTILENKFVSPATARKAEWVHAMLSVL